MAAEAEMDTTSLSGFGERQLTPRAVLVGVFVGGLMCFSNMCVWVARPSARRIDLDCFQAWL